MAVVYATVSKRTVCFFFSTRITHFCSSASPPSPTDETAVTTAVSVLKHHRSKSRWTHLRTLFPSGFSSSQFSQITIQLRNSPHLAHRFFLFTIQHSLCDHSLLSYATIIHTLSRSRQKSDALTLIRSAIRKFHDANTNLPPNTPPLILGALIKTYRTCDSAPFVFDLLIKACLQSKRIDQALEIVRMLRSKVKNNIAINGESYEFMIKGLCDEGMMEEGMKLQAEMVGRGYGPNLEIYYAFIDGYEKEGNTELACKLRTEVLGMQ